MYAFERLGRNLKVSSVSADSFAPIALGINVFEGMSSFKCNTPYTREFTQVLFLESCQRVLVRAGEVTRLAPVAS